MVCGSLFLDVKSGAGCYHFGFNGKEKDAEGEWGTQTHYDYGFRIYEPGIGRFLSVDPLMKEYPFYTPYQFAGNNPIWATDLDGLEEKIEVMRMWHNSEGILLTETSTVYRNVNEGAQVVNGISFADYASTARYGTTGNLKVVESLNSKTMGNKTETILYDNLLDKLAYFGRNFDDGQGEGIVWTSSTQYPGGVPETRKAGTISGYESIDDMIIPAGGGAGGGVSGSRLFEIKYLNPDLVSEITHSLDVVTDFITDMSYVNNVKKSGVDVAMDYLSNEFDSPTPDNTTQNADEQWKFVGYGDSTGRVATGPEWSPGNLDDTVEFNTLIFSNGQRDSTAPAKWRIQTFPNPEYGDPDGKVSPINLPE